METCNQIELDFNKPIVHRENNQDSQKQFEDNEPVFRGQCKTIMKAFKRGERLTTASALLKYKIGDLRARIRDLKNTYNVTNLDYNELEGRYKEWYLKLD